MRVVILPNKENVANFCADQIAALIKQKNSAVLGLATGSTPIKTYQKLIKKHQEGDLSFAQVSTFNLDEYIGLEATHPQSYRTFMNQYFFDHIDINSENTMVPDGLHKNFEENCAAYEDVIKQKGGIDCQLLGIGENGHIGFNEPTSSLSSRTRVKTLSPQTIANNARFFNVGERQPQLAITMGIGTIMEAKRIILVATGEQKKQAIANLVEGAVSAFTPASILQMHPKAMIIIDEAAASQLALKDYYLHVEAIQETLTKTS
jgi:glucosamine-6-phosphate deaminase